MCFLVGAKYKENTNNSRPVNMQLWQSALANSVPAVAVILRMQALSGMIGRKASVGGFLSLPSNLRAQPWTGGGNYQAGVR
jgi:hypothetical protein